MVFIFFVACYFFLPSKEKNSTSESQSVTTAAPLNAATANLLGLADDEDNSNQDAQVSNDYCASNEHWVKLADVCYQVELALDPFSRARGLGFRQSMPTEHGMLYPYDQEAIFSHGTKGMLFPLDILFFDNERRLVGIYHNAPPCSIDNNTCPPYSSHRPARYALELNAGQANKLNLKLGDELIVGPTIFHEYESYKSSLCKIQDKIKRFSIPANMLEQQQRLVHLILCTESMDDEEKQYWFNMLPSMNETQLARLLDILETERTKLKELAVKYQKEIEQINTRLPLRDAPQPECNYTLNTTDSPSQGINRKVNCQLYQLRCIDGPIRNNIENYASSVAIAKIYDFNNVPMDERGVLRLIHILEQHISEGKTCPLTY